LPFGDLIAHAKLRPSGNPDISQPCKSGLGGRGFRPKGTRFQLEKPGLTMRSCPASDARTVTSADRPSGRPSRNQTQTDAFTKVFVVSQDANRKRPNGTDAMTDPEGSR
jgi:hypothetical protein